MSIRETYLFLFISENTYNQERALLFPDKDLFIKATIEDILEQCICILVLSNKGYRFQFYPGTSYTAVEHINSTLLSEKRPFNLEVQQLSKKR